MSFSELNSYREALASVPGRIINPSMRSLLWVIISYSDGCWIGEDELGAQSGLSRSNLKKVRQRCDALKLLSREHKRARHGTRQSYRVDLTRLQELARGENIDPFKNVDQENNLTSEEIVPSMGISKSPDGEKDLAPYRKERNQKYKKHSSENLFKDFIMLLPIEKRFPHDDKVAKQLRELEHKGTSLEVIRAHLRPIRWESIQHPKGFIAGQLRELLARERYYTVNNPPPKCEPECQKADGYSNRFPGENGATSNVCYACHPYYVNKRNGYAI